MSRYMNMNAEFLRDPASCAACKSHMLRTDIRVYALGNCCRWEEETLPAGTGNRVVGNCGVGDTLFPPRCGFRSLGTR